MRGFDLDAATKEGETALVCAMRFADQDVIQWLVRQGAETNIRDRNKVPLLRMSVARVSAEILQVLLEAGAAPNIDCETTVGGALDEAVYQQYGKIIQMLLKWGARVSWLDIQTAIRAGVDSGIIQVLFEEIPEHDMHDARAVLSTLQTAVIYGNSKVVEVLLKSGIIDRDDPNFSDPDTLIHACRGGHAGIVQFLLEHGFDANVVNLAGLSALDVAMLDDSNTEIVRMLRASGALSYRERSRLKRA